MSSPWVASVSYAPTFVNKKLKMADGSAKVLELMTFLLKRPTRAFVSHRAAKHKTPGRGGAVPDSSFHKNLGQVESWMTSLAKDAAKKAKAKNEPIYNGVEPLLVVVSHMLAILPQERPPIHSVQKRVYQVLLKNCGILEPHCVHQYDKQGELGFTNVLSLPRSQRNSTSGSRHSRTDSGDSNAGGGNGRCTELPLRQKKTLSAGLDMLRSSVFPT